MEVTKIAEIDFRDVKVDVYNDPCSNSEDYSCCWQSRNPQSFYQGLVYMGADGKITYPKDAVIPEQTERDREMLPKFIVTGHKEVSEQLLDGIDAYLKSEYARRNNKNG